MQVYYNSFFFHASARVGSGVIIFLTICISPPHHIYARRRHRVRRSRTEIQAQARVRHKTYYAKSAAAVEIYDLIQICTYNNNNRLVRIYVYTRKHVVYYYT